MDDGQAWDYYFPYATRNVHYETTDLTSFVSLLRYSLYRPRDILVILSILKENFIENNRKPDEKFKEDDLLEPMFTRKYSDYFLGEIKDHLSFYYPAEDYEEFLKFFQYLDGKSRFTYDDFIGAFDSYLQYFNKNNVAPPGFCRSPDGFLQFLYEMNVIGYVIDTEDKPYFGWCYRERTPSNISPKVKTGVRYDSHYAVMKALDLGTKFKKSS